MDPTVSIIIPVFNAEASLRRCVDSVLYQEYKDFELILVDDGSTDFSGAICDEYSAVDSRVKVIHKENSGVSDSRNKAMALAKGEFFQFVDSDDWIAPDCTRLMVRTAQENSCDLVITDFYRVSGERVSHKGDIDTDGIMTREAFAACMMEDPADFYYGVLWNKLYRSSIIEQFQLKMDTRISWCEDFMFNLEYIRYANVFYALRTPTYYYVRTKGSLASQGMSLAKSIKMKKMVFEYYNNLYKHIMNEETYEKNRLQVYRFLIDAASDGIVPPILFPNSKKLGEERLSICSPAIKTEGSLMDIYRYRKLLEYYLRPVALKNDLSLRDIWVLFCASHNISYSKKELADLAGISVRNLSSSLQRLISKKIISVEEIRDMEEKSGNKKRIKLFKITILAENSGLAADLETVETDFSEAFLDGFDEEERQMYDRLLMKSRKNIQRILGQKTGVFD